VISRRRALSFELLRRRGRKKERGGEGRRGSKELREMEVKMAGADGAKIGPLFAF